MADYLRLGEGWTRTDRSGLDRPRWINRAGARRGAEETLSDQGVEFEYGVKAQHQGTYQLGTRTGPDVEVRIFSSFTEVVPADDEQDYETIDSHLEPADE